MPCHPTAPAMPASQGERVAGVVEGAPGFGLVGWPAPPLGLVPSLQRVVPRHLAGCHRIDEDLEPRLSHPAEEVEVLETEEPGGVGEHSGVEHRARDQRGSPAGDIHRHQLRRRAGGRHQVLRMGAAADEPPSVGDHRAHPPRWLERADARQQCGDPGDGQVEQTDVVLAQVGPSSRRFREGLHQTRPEPTGGPAVLAEPHGPDPSLECRFVQATFAIDHQHDTVRWEPLGLEQLPDDIPRQPRPHVGEHHGGHIVRDRRCSSSWRCLTPLYLHRLPTVGYPGERARPDQARAWEHEFAPDQMISVILPVRNGLPWLEEQLQGLLGQQCDSDWELIVADNGSTDGSPAVVGRWVDRHEQVRLIDASTAPGAPGARNRGAAAARGELLAFCDADDLVLPGWLAAGVAALAHVDVVGGIFDFWSLNGRPGRPPIPAAMSQFGFLPAGLSANLAIRREAFQAVGGFDESLSVGEDIDLCWRLQLAGFRFAIEPGAVVSKREPTAFASVFRHAYAYGCCGPLLYRRYRPAGARRDLTGAAKSWLWLLVHSPRLAKPGPARSEWARAAGMRLGRLAGSLGQRVFFP